jgi:hypothetical protein
MVGQPDRDEGNVLEAFGGRFHAGGLLGWTGRGMQPETKTQAGYAVGLVFGAGWFNEGYKSSCQNVDFLGE